MNKSKIEWTEETWNPVSGCSKISPGCLNCYAERMAYRLKAIGVENYRNGFKLTCHPHTLLAPLSWKKSRMIFVNSMSDLFHEELPTSYIKKVFQTMNMARHHTFQVLTKRAERLEQISHLLTWNSNIWMGVTIESSDYIYRIKSLKKTKAKVKFLSLEPLLGPLPNLKLKGIDWVIVGGESGPGARPMREEWVVSLKRQCLDNDVPFFFKQWGGVNKKRSGRLLEGKIWDQMPDLIPQEEKYFLSGI